jgi:hypothetical protein
VAHLNDSTRRPDKFPQHNPDPAIREPPAPMHPSAAHFPQTHKLTKKCIGCRFGAGKCFCTNSMAADKAKSAGMGSIRIHGFSDLFTVKGVKNDRTAELVLFRKRVCPLIAAR